MRFIRFTRAVLLVLAMLATALVAGVVPASAAPLPTIVLVHGAFADTTSWDGVAADLRGRGYTVVVPDNPLRGPGYDSGRDREDLAGISDRSSSSGIRTVAPSSPTPRTRT